MNAVACDKRESTCEKIPPSPGVRYGRLTVVRRGESRKHTGVMWVCICDCGRETEKSASELKIGRARSCGCLRRRASGITDGQVVGRWTVLIARVEGLKQSSLCRCACGKEKFVHTYQLADGSSTSCGCLKLEKQTKHGKHRSPEYKSWAAMINRCKLSNNHKNYAGRGISVCDRWLSFESFLEDMGERPNGKSLDRIDNDGNYEPGNCRWADRVTQSRNRRTNRLISIRDTSMTIADAADLYSIPRGRLYYWISRRGLSGDQALSRILGHAELCKDG